MRRGAFLFALLSCSSGTRTPLALHPSALDLAAGSTATIAVEAEQASGLSIDGLPSGVTATFSKTDGVTLAVSIAADAAPGNYALAVRSPSSSARLALTIEPSGSLFSLSSGANGLMLPQGGEAAVRIDLARLNGFTGAVDVSITAPPGITAAPLTIERDKPNGMLSIAASTLAALGKTHLDLRGTSGASTATLGIDLAITPPSGTLDTTFGKNGIVIESTMPMGMKPIDITSAAMQADGKLVVVGDVYFNASAYDVLVLRYMPDGSIDPSFGTGGLTTVDLGTKEYDVATSVAIQPDGKIVVAGNHAYGEMAAVRFDASGTLDPTFGNGGIWLGVPGKTYATNANALALRPDGRIVLAGVCSSEMRVVGLTSAGAIDPAFGIVAGTGGALTAVTIEGDGTIATAGSDTNDWIVWRLHPDGTTSTFNAIDFAGKPDDAQSIASQPDGKLVVGGTATTASGIGLALARLDNGVLDPTFGTNGRALVGTYAGIGGNPILLQPDGKILLGGGSTYNGGPSTVLVRTMPSGALDPSWDGTGRVFTTFGADAEWVRRLFRLGDGKILAVGFATDPIHDVVMARYWP
jgi:uncharacterized delta-60 repeat protein